MDQHAHIDSPELGWDGHRPVSRRFGDGYFAAGGGLAETRHVFLDGNGLPDRFERGFHIAELGFGTGLNLLAAWACWRESGQRGPLHYTGFEAFPLPADAMARALDPFRDLADLAAPLLDAWAAGARQFAFDDLNAKVIVGDARHTLPDWWGQADAWFLDGFAPDRNPEMWEPALMAAVADHSARGATLASYTAAGHVRRSLEAAGFVIERRPGFGTKRHMIAGRLA